MIVDLQIYKQNIQFELCLQQADQYFNTFILKKVQNAYLYLERYLLAEHFAI